MPLSVSFEPSELAVEPGGSVRAAVRVANHGAAADRVRLSVTGSAAPWAWVTPPELDLEPGAEAVASLGFRVPVASEPAAGPHLFDVVAGSTREAGPDTRAPGVLTVAPTVDLSLRLEPEDGDDGDRRVMVVNGGNVAAQVALSGRSDDPGVAVELTPGVVTAAAGEEVPVAVRVRVGRRPLLRGRSRSFAVVLAADGAPPSRVRGTIHQPAAVALRRAAVTAVVLAVAVMAALVVGTRSDDGGGASVAASGTTAPPSGAGAAGEGGCVVEGHADPRVTGLERDDIPTLPPDFSFFQIASDGCTPVRWNPCEPVHFVINPTNAPPTGVADVREAFRRLAEVTGMTYVDDGITDESGEGRREAYQPQRYGERWAPILVHWQHSGRGTESIQVVGGGVPTRAGDVYVSGNLFLNPFVVTNAETRTTVAGGFGAAAGTGPIGPEGVTWGRIILHELAHITGLGHTRDPAQLMYPETSEHLTRPAKFDVGDLAGLRHLGREAGCLTTPPVDTPTARGRRAGGQAPTTAAP